MPVAFANINPDNLTWARERAQLSIAALAQKIRVKDENVQAWEKGDKKPTFKQARNVADSTYVPFGYLFLPQTPLEKLSIPDLRTVDGLHTIQPSARLLKVIEIMTARQQWFKDYLTEQGVFKNDVVGQFNLDSKVIDIVYDMKLRMGLEELPSKGNWQEYERELVKRIENIGVMVMRQGDLGHFTQSLSVEEFRGFAMCDAQAPLIFINTADAPSAKLFTLIHELAHIWLGQSGISDGKPNAHYREEVLCNAVAAEFLVPELLFCQHWQEFADWRDNLPVLERMFHVSSYVLARRALTVGFINEQQYHQYVMYLRKQWESREKQGGGPSYYMIRKSQVSDGFARAILSQALSGQMLLRDASGLLGVKPNKLKDLAKVYDI